MRTTIEESEAGYDPEAMAALDRLVAERNKLRGIARLLAGWQEPPCNSPETRQAFMRMVEQARGAIR